MAIGRGLRAQVARPMRLDGLRGGVAVLELVQVGVEPLLCQQLTVCALLDDPPTVDDQHLIGVLDGREAVRDDEGRPAAEQLD